MNARTLVHPAFAIGLETLFSQLAESSKRQSFPHYDVEVVDQESGDYRLTLAVAGYSEQDIQILHKENKLLISGDKKRDENKVFQHEGIAKRDFKIDFILHQYAVIKKADLKNGLLEIDIKIEIPEDKQPKSIKIGA